jgi:RHS repeat-associated protein
VATSLAGGVLGAQYRYDPYGKLQVALNETAATASEYGYTNALRLTGDLWHLKARVYDAAARVFLQSDSVDRYRYAYVQGDPANLSDPTGLLPVNIVWEGMETSGSLYATLGGILMDGHTSYGTSPKGPPAPTENAQPPATPEDKVEKTADESLATGLHGTDTSETPPVGALICPVQQDFIVMSPYGQRTRTASNGTQTTRMHAGEDQASANGEAAPTYAPFNSTATVAEQANVGGITKAIEYRFTPPPAWGMSMDLKVVSRHVDPSITTGQVVQAGQSTGSLSSPQSQGAYHPTPGSSATLQVSTGYHNHVEVYKNNKPINPALLFPPASGCRTVTPSFFRLLQ